MPQSPSTPASKTTVADNQPDRSDKKGAGDSSKAAATLTEKLESARATSSQDKQADEAPVRRAAPTQPARRQVAANDDLPSIGGLIYALQQRPSRSPFLFAFAASVIWLLIGGGAGWAMVSSNASTISDFGGFITHPIALAVAATVIIPIALFWFLALLIWRAQELRLMASAMTEVAVRLAEPDKMAEQSVASLGQTIRRQVAAMNDAISRALGRAGELEALVHNEVAALENSYSDNELRIRRLIDELSSEREALANNSERVSDALRGVGSQVAKDINIASEQATRSLGTATANIAESLTAKSGKITAAMTAAGAAIDNKLAERGTKLTEAIQQTSQKAADAVDVKANALFHSLNSVGDKLSKDVPGLLERLDGEQKRLNTIIAAANQNFSALETALAQRAVQLDSTLNERTEQFRVSVVEHATQIDSTLKRRSDQITSTLASQATQIDSSLKERTGELASTLATQATQIDSSLKERTGELASTLATQATQIDSSLKKRTGELASTLATQATQIDSSLKERTGELASTLATQATQIDSSLKERTEELKISLAERIKALDGTVRKQTDSIEQSMNKNTMALNQAFAEGADAVKRNTLALEHAFAEGAEAVKQNSLQMSQNTSHATQNMKAQAETLKQVSNGMLQQIHGLTQRFETQGQAIMTAANALDSSNAKIDSILERRHSEISALLDMVSNKAQDLDKMMRSYTGIIDSSLINVEARAKELSASLVQESTAQSRATVEEIERLRADARLHTSKAVEELQQNFGAITQQVANQLGSLTQQFGKTTREMRSTASQTVGEIENTRQELQRRMRDLPQESRQSADAMRKAVSDQLQALDSLSAIAKEHQSAPAPLLHNTPALPPQGYNPPPHNGNGGASRGMHAGSQLPISGSALQPQGTAPQQSGPASYSNESSGQQQEDLRAVTSTLAQRLAGSTPPRNTSSNNADGGNGTQSGVGVRITGGPPQVNQAERWSVGDLLARASEPDSRDGFAPPRQEAPHSTPVQAPGDLRLTDLARAIDHGTAADIWQRFQRGERGIFSRQLYTNEGQAAFDEITTRFQHDAEFRATVDRYIGDFERLLAEAEGKGQDSAIVQNYLTSETGRVYLMLAHASGRLQ